MGAVVLTDAGVQYVASLVPPVWAGLFKVGLFSNDVDPGHGTTIGTLVPASFSGYNGLRTLSYWTGPTWDGTRATLTGPPVEWTYDGGGITGRVYGYYVVNLSGVLCWAKRRDPPAWLTIAGQTYRVTPQWTVRSEF